MSDELRDIFKNEVIRASAGTGKTFELSNRFLRLLASGVDCETILATTFTRKGAGEILDRIVQRLAKGALSETAANELAQQLGWKLDQSRVQDLLRELIENLHRLQIGTLDAFFYRIAQTFRLELELPTQWQIAGEQQIAMLQARIVHDILRDEDVATLLHLMTHGEVQRKIADLIRLTVNSLYEIFTQSKQDDWHRLQVRKDYSPKRTFLEQADELPTLEYTHGSQRNSVKKDVECIKNGDWNALAKKSIFNNILAGEPIFYNKPLPDRCVEIYKELIEHCRGYVIDMLMRQNESTFKLLDKFGTRFEEEKTRLGQLRFDDVTTRLEEFIKDKQTDDFAFRLDHNVNHLLLDEFQDTSIAQWNVIAPFAQRTTEDGTRKSFFCVGDLKQAIFGWRGGVAEIFDTVECNLSNVGSARSLVKSYRSSQVIIDSVNNVFENIARYTPEKQVVRDAIASWSQTFARQETARDELPGHFTLEFAGDGQSKAWAKDRERNDNVMFATVEKIRGLIEAMPQRTIGVLVRKNETVGELIYMLRNAGIAASEEGGNFLTDSAAIEKLLAVLILADHPNDSIARYTVSHSPLSVELGLVPETQSNQKENVRAAQQASEKIRGDLISSGYGVTLERYARILAPVCTQRELSRLQQLVQEAFNYEKAIDQTRIKLRPAKFVEYIRSEFKASDASSANVRVMTIHQSKGLEFDVVVLPMFFARNGWFSHQSSVIVGREHPTAPIDLVCRLTNQSFRKLLPTEFQEAFDESERREIRDEICLLYVAMTRAIHATHAIVSYGLKPDQHASGAILLATLYPGERREGVVLELGDKNWHQEMCTAEIPTSEPAISSEYYLPLDATVTTACLASESRSGRGIQRVSPSSMEGGVSIRMGAIFETIAKSEQLDQGTFVHACFEKLHWIEDGVVDRAQLTEHIQSRGPLPASSEDLLKLFYDSVEQPNLKNLLTLETYLSDFAADRDSSGDPLRAEVFNERPFSVNVDNKLMQGVIDRLVLIYKGDDLIAADIIDFKTDAISATNLKDRVQHYRPQLLAYRNAVSEFCKLPTKNINVRLAFVKTDQVIKLGDSDQPAVVVDEAPSQPKNTTSPSPPKFMQGKQLRLWCDE